MFLFLWFCGFFFNYNQGIRISWPSNLCSILSSGLNQLSWSKTSRQEICSRRFQTRFMVSFLQQQHNFALTERNFSAACQIHIRPTGTRSVKYPCQIYNEATFQESRRTHYFEKSLYEGNYCDRRYGEPNIGCSVMAHGLIRVPSSIPYYKETNLLFGGIRQTQ